MEVIFRTKRLGKCYKSHQQGYCSWGAEVARKYILRIDLIQEATDMTEIGKLPVLNCHPLRGRREGQYGITIHDRWRLIFSLKGERAEVIRVEEVSKHYDD